MTEEERVKAIPVLSDWRRQDQTIGEIVAAMCRATGQPSVGHLARHMPEVFDALYEEASALITNPQ